MRGSLFLIILLFSQLVKAATISPCSVTTLLKIKRTSESTRFANGLIVTLNDNPMILSNAHPVRDLEQVEFSFPGRAQRFMKAKLVVQDNSKDLALYQPSDIEKSELQKLLRVGKSTRNKIESLSPNITMPIYAPTWNGHSCRPEQSSISGNARLVPDYFISGTDYKNILKVLGFAAPGFSGSPIFDQNGNFAGIITIVDAGFSPNFYAIPNFEVKNFVSQWARLFQENPSQLNAVSRVGGQWISTGTGGSFLRREIFLDDNSKIEVDETSTNGGQLLKADGPGSRGDGPGSRGDGATHNIWKLIIPNYKDGRNRSRYFHIANPFVMGETQISINGKGRIYAVKNNIFTEYDLLTSSDSIKILGNSYSIFDGKIGWQERAYILPTSAAVARALKRNAFSDLIFDPLTSSHLLRQMPLSPTYTYFFNSLGDLILQPNKSNLEPVISNPQMLNLNQSQLISRILIYNALKLNDLEKVLELYSWGIKEYVINRKNIIVTD